MACRLDATPLAPCLRVGGTLGNEARKDLTTSFLQALGTPLETMGRVLSPQLWFGGPQAQKQKAGSMPATGHRYLSEHVSSDLDEHLEASLQVGAAALPS